LTDPPIETPREQLEYMLHGQRVSDPYRWLENSASPRVQAWIVAQNQLFERSISSVAERDTIRSRLEQLLQIGDVSLPEVVRLGGSHYRYFFTRREAGQDQPVLLARDGLNGPDRVLVDPNQLSAAGTVSLDWYFPSRNGCLVAYGLSREGDEQSVLRVLDVSTGRSLPEQITRTRHCSLCWNAAGTGFCYSRFAAPGSVPPGQEHYHRSIYSHTLGTDPDADSTVFGPGRRPTEYPSCTLSPNGRWLVVRTSQGWSRSELFLADTTRGRLEFAELVGGQEHLYDALALDDILYVRTNEGAPRGALYAVQPEDPVRARWRLVLAEHPTDVLHSFHVVGGQILAVYQHEGLSRLQRFDAQGRSRGEVPLPDTGTSDGFSGWHDGSEAFFNFESFVHPTRIQRLDLNTDRVDTWMQIASPFATNAFEVLRGRAPSKDGTRIPYLLVRSHKTWRAGPDAPTLLYGYGGFGHSLVPRFSRTTAFWLERGGVYVSANLRGGGEFGETWHRAGQLNRKQNCFDDFIGVAEHLVAEGLTTRDKLAIYGRSNGGLLVCAVMTQRPELVRAAVAAVALTDMLRYQQFLLGRLWVPEYGSADDAEQLPWLLAYSPYHRVRENTAYPAVLLTTAASDTRVDPLHARKMAAALQHATISGRPVLLRTELQAGHGAGKPASMIAAEYADIFSFLLWQLDARRSQTEPRSARAAGHRSRSRD
jgi:prolyl oligopeptidase